MEVKVKSFPIQIPKLLRNWYKYQLHSKEIKQAYLCPDY